MMMKLYFAILGLILLPLIAISQQSYTVEIHKLNFRTGPGANYSSNFSLDEGDEVEYIKSSKNGWWLVEYNGIRGYVASKYLEPSTGYDFSSLYSTNPFLQDISKNENRTIDKTYNSTSTTLPNSFYSDWQNTSTDQTYKIGGTEYFVNEYYSTTGLPKVKRNMTARKEFLERMGHKEVPDGFEVNHIKPLSEGGADESWNMQLLTVEEHKRKTATERARHSNISTSTLDLNSYNSTTTPALNLNSYNTTTTKPSQSPTFQPNRTIQTGPRGGQYYINGNGNKTYVKSKN